MKDYDRSNAREANERDVSNVNEEDKSKIEKSKRADPLHEGAVFVIYLPFRVVL